MNKLQQLWRNPFVYAMTLFVVAGVVVPPMLFALIMWATYLYNWFWPNGGFCNQ